MYYSRIGDIAEERFANTQENLFVTAGRKRKILRTGGRDNLLPPYDQPYTERHSFGLVTDRDRHKDRHSFELVTNRDRPFGKLTNIAEEFS